MASIEHRRNTRSGDSWRVKYRLDGRQRVVTFDTQARAEAWRDLVNTYGPERALALLDIDAGGARPGKVRSVREQVLAHVEQLTGITSGTRATYTRMADYAFGRLAGMPLPTVTAADTAAWLNDMTAEGLSGKTQRNRHGLLYGAFDSAVRDGLIADNPCRRQRIATTHRDDSEKVFLTPEEFAAIASHLSGQGRALVVFLVGTGVRFGEATALRVGDVDVAAGVARVQRAWKHTGKAARELGTTKTRRSRRTVRFGTAVADEIRPLLEGRRPSDLLFTNRNGRQVGHASFWSHVWAPAVRRAAGDELGRRRVGGRLVECTVVEGPGPRPRIHDLRHTFASWAIQAGVPLPVIQRQLGHESIKTTVDVYGHLSVSDFDAVAASSDRNLAVLGDVRGQILP